MLEEPEFELGPPQIAFWPCAVHRCQMTNGREFEGKAAESLESETLRYPLRYTLWRARRTTWGLFPRRSPESPCREKRQRLP